MDALHAIDVAAFFAINRVTHPQWLDALMLFLSARATWFVVAGLIVGTAVVRRDFALVRLCLLVGLAVGVTDAFTYQVLKPTFKRPRPCHQMSGEVRLVHDRCGGDYGFPSNHAANGAAVAAVVVLATRRRAKWTAVALAGLVGLSRIYLGVHFLGDILAGFAVGGLFGVGIYWFYRKRIEPRFAGQAV